MNTYPITHSTTIQTETFIVKLLCIYLAGCWTHCAIWVQCDVFCSFHFHPSDVADKRIHQSGQSNLEETTADQVNSKATIVIESMIQASDVFHTMQHWHIYRKWNERYFLECYDAYLNGRTTTDPSITWYEGDYEYLQNAKNNRAEWASRGKEIVEEMKELATVTHQRPVHMSLRVLISERNDSVRTVAQRVWCSMMADNR
jgi:hypothetical protein